MERILIIDDDVEICIALKEVLELHLDCEVDTAHDGEAGLEKLRANSFGVVLIDYKMPKLKGIAVIEEMHKSRLKGEIIFMSGDIQDDIAQKARSLGVQYVFGKPIATEALVFRIKQIMAS